MRKLILLLAILLITFFITEKFHQWPVPYRDSKFLDRATNFYTKDLKIEVSNKVVENIAISNNFNPQKKLIKLERELDTFFENSPHDVLENLQIIKVKQDELKLLIAQYDQKIDQTLTLDPMFRVGICLYLETQCDTLNESSWINGEIPAETWHKLYLASQSNDFKLLIRERRLTKEKLSYLINKMSQHKASEK